MSIFLFMAFPCGITRVTVIYYVFLKLKSRGEKLLVFNMNYIFLGKSLKQLVSNPITGLPLRRHVFQLSFNQTVPQSKIQHGFTSNLQLKGLPHSALLQIKVQILPVL